MFIKQLNYITEFFLWVLVFGITLGNAPTEVASYWIIFLFLVKKIILKDIKFPGSLMDVLFCIFFVIVFVSFLRSNNFNDSLRGFSRVPKYLFLYLALTDFFAGDKKRITRFFWVIMAVSTVTFLNGIFQSIFGFDIFKHNVMNKSEHLLRINSAFVHPNDFAAYIVTVLPLALLFFKKELSSKKRIILAAIFLIGLYCLMRTSSRGAWVGFIFAMIFFFSVYRRKMLIFIPIVAIVVILLAPSGIYRVKDLLKPSEGSAGERMVLWQGTWTMIKSHPVLGSGINTFMKNFEKYYPTSCQQGFYVHNSYLQMWSEIGIVGLIVFLAIPLTVIIRAFTNIKTKIRSSPEGVILLSSICGYISFLVHAAVDNNLFSLVLTTLFWVFSAYIVSFNNYLKEKIN
ncbi:MAG: O-antigen ligase family protein, partial [Candidatus Omnitrophota bacterium]